MSIDRSEINDAIDSASDTVRSAISGSKDQISQFGKKGRKALKQASSQAQHGLDYLDDEALAVKRAVIDYVNAKPVESLAIGIGALWLIRKILK